VRPVVIALALVALAPALARAASVAADIAAHLRSEVDECGLLLDLCRGVAQAQEHAAATPGGADVLDFRNAEELRIRIADARDAARIIRDKHHGAEPACFRAPECAFLRAEAR
jgi:hypothetical protein